MNEYEVQDYGLFQDGVSSVQTLNNNLSSCLDVLEESKATLGNDSIFMGPVSDSCLDGIDMVASQLSGLNEDFSTMGDFLINSSSSYQASDAAASSNVSSGGGSYSSGGGGGGASYVSSGASYGSSSGAAVASIAASSGSSGSSGSVSENQKTIYDYLSQKGFNDAAISGILANIQHESDFNPHSLGDGGTSYGICQWHNSRWTKLKNYCSQNGLDSTTLDGQLSYLVYELQTSYPSVYQKIRSVPNTAEGAYEAAYEWTVHFEIPANKEATAQKRASSAVSQYWPRYSTQSA